jgi:REP element-mobilizing transposase RayT
MTITVVGWIDVFTRLGLKNIIVDSLNYCVTNKNLTIYAWCLMSNHLHLLAQAENPEKFSDIIRDFKTFTSKKIIQFIQAENESRKEWMLKYFALACEHLARNQQYKVWQDGFHPEEVSSPSFLYQKLDYLHKNPVKDLIVANEEDYLYSSARNYADFDGLVEVIVLDHKPIIIS